MGNYLNQDLEGKKIRLLGKYNNDALNTDVPFLVEGGFGASPRTWGSALFIKNTETGNCYKIDSHDKMELVEENGKKGKSRKSKGKKSSKDKKN